jgi:hypothetical protein
MATMTDPRPPAEALAWAAEATGATTPARTVRRLPGGTHATTHLLHTTPAHQPDRGPDHEADRGPDRELVCTIERSGTDWIRGEAQRPAVSR